MDGLRNDIFLRVFECDIQGNCVEVSKSLADITRLKTEWNLPISDMRMFFHHHGNSAQDGLPAILSRPLSKCFLVNLEHIKLLCRRDYCMILHSEEPAVQLFVEELKKQLTSHKSSNDSNVNRMLNAKNNTQTSSSNNDMHKILNALTTLREVKLEFAVLETTLATIANKYKHHLSLLKPIIDILLQDTLSNPSTGMLRRMLAFMKNLNAFEMSVTMVRSAIVEVLGEDEDLVGLCLSSGGTDKVEEEEMELLLEAYSSDLKEIECELANIKEQIEDTNDFMNIHLSTIRNSFMKMSMIIEMGTLAVGAGALIAGIFGMNLKNGQEDSDTTFLIVSVATCIVVFVIAILFFAYIHWFTSLNTDFSSSISSHALTRFFSYAKEVESDLVQSTGNGKRNAVSRKEFRRILEPVIGPKLKGHKVDKVFRVLFLNESRDDMSDEGQLTVDSSDEYPILSPLRSV